eukprot:TRINITY_DN143_c0_g5_i1.p1 TRINITY_DN143_c0_g5~~TRINITY_DN143_c0_g5_i1.p1  ORF type:complete len:210 (-),score=23.59 TRINITY_DN143_c0_g5_i1:112-741(-)
MTDLQNDSDFDFQINLNESIENDDDEDDEIDLDVSNHQIITVNLNIPHPNSFNEKINEFASFVLFSKKYYYFCAAMIILNISLCLWVLWNYGEFPNSILFFLLEVIINLMLAIEVILKIILVGKHYFSSCWNKVDLVILFICFLSLVFYHRKLLDTVAIIALPIRYIIQISRIIVLIKNQKEKERNENEIDLIDLNDITTIYDENQLNI